MGRTCEWARNLWHHLPEGKLRVDKRTSISPKMCHKSERKKWTKTKKTQKTLPDKGRQLFVLLLLSCFICVWLCVTLWTVACQAPLSLGFSGQEYPNGLPCPPPRNLPQPGIEPRYPESSASQGDCWTTREAQLFVQLGKIGRAVMREMVILFSFVGLVYFPLVLVSPLQKFETMDTNQERKCK